MAASILLIPLKERDQLYPNTRVPTQLNTNQHDSTRAQHESTRVRHESTQVSKSKKVKESSRRVNANQQKSDISLTRI